METLFDAGMIVLKSISPRKGIYYGMLRCRLLPSEENFQIMAVTSSVIFVTDFSLACTVPHFPSTKGRDQNFLLSLWM